MILDRMEDVEEVEEIKAEVSSTFSTAIEKRQQINCRLKSLLDSYANAADYGAIIYDIRNLKTY